MNKHISQVAFIEVLRGSLATGSVTFLLYCTLQFPTIPCPWFLLFFLWLAWVSDLHTFVFLCYWKYTFSPILQSRWCSNRPFLKSSSQTERKSSFQTESSSQFKILNLKVCPSPFPSSASSISSFPGTQFSWNKSILTFCFLG